MPPAKECFLCNKGDTWRNTHKAGENKSITVGSTGIYHGSVHFIG